MLKNQPFSLHFYWILDTENLIKRRIRQNHTSLIVKEGDSVTISPDIDVVNRISTESPDSDMRWSLNGIFVEEEKNRIRLRNHNISKLFQVLAHSYKHFQFDFCYSYK